MGVGVATKIQQVATRVAKAVGKSQQVAIIEIVTKCKMEGATRKNQPMVVIEEIGKIQDMVVERAT
jgi:hypothetical protein